MTTCCLLDQNSRGYRILKFALLTSVTFWDFLYALPQLKQIRAIKYDFERSYSNPLIWNIPLLLNWEYVLMLFWQYQRRIKDIKDYGSLFNSTDGFLFQCVIDIICDVLSKNRPLLALNCGGNSKRVLFVSDGFSLNPHLTGLMVLFVVMFPIRQRKNTLLNDINTSWPIKSRM